MSGSREAESEFERTPMPPRAASRSRSWPQEQNPKPAKIKREVSRLAEPYQPANNTATRSEESATDWVRSLLARFTKCPNEVIFDTGLNDGELRVLLALNPLDWNEKGWSEHSEETMASQTGKTARPFHK